MPISAFIFGARRSDTVPLVSEARTWEEGVYKAATMGSETTAAAAGAVGEVRRDPFAMLPFCGYHVGDYFQHWLDMGERVAHPPQIFSVNWFRKDADGKFVWPGLRPEHARAAVDRRALRGTRARARNGDGLGAGLCRPQLDRRAISMRTASTSVMRVDRAQWQRELASHDELFAKLGAKRPAALQAERERLGKRLSA